MQEIPIKCLTYSIAAKEVAISVQAVNHSYAGQSLKKYGIAKEVAIVYKLIIP